MQKTSWLRWVNWGLLAAIVLVNCYTILLPFWPAVPYWWQQNHSPQQAELSALVASDDIPSDNRLVAPTMLLNQTIFSGTDPATVHKGIWHIPHTSTPPQGGNTVLAGHRFTYDGNGVFYHLDKLKMGDQLAVFWEGKKYEYTVTETKVVPATATEIEDPTEDAQLTLYTCTPLWSAKDRLVVIAKPLTEESL